MISHYDPEIKRRLDDLRGNGKLTSPDIQNVFILVMFNRLFEMSDYATKGLQCSTITVTDCIDLIEGLKENYIEENRS